MNSTKNSTTQFFLLYPSKTKIIISLLFSFSLLIILLTTPSYGIQSIFLNRELSNQILIILVSLLFGFIAYYPLACGLIYILKIITKKEKSHPRNLVIAVFFIIIFNPVTFGIIFTNINLLKNNRTISSPVNSTANTATNEKLCGLQIIEITAPSAMNAGLSVGEIIKTINNNPVGDMNALIHALADKKPGDTVTVVTSANTHNVTLFASPQNPGQTLMGIKLKQIPCGK